jgi:hypothetical protein
MAVQRTDDRATDERTAGEDLAGKEFLFAALDRAGRFVLAGEGQWIAGVISYGAPTGKPAAVRIAGFPLKVIAGEAIAPGDRVQAGPGGVAIRGSTNAFGRARNRTAAAGEYVEVVP